MPKALICEKWEMEFEEYVPEDGKKPFENRPFLDNIFRDGLKDVSDSAEASYKLLSGLPTGKTVVEFFGGIGLQSLIVENLLHPIEHVVLDKDSQCVEHLKRVFQNYPDVLIAQADAWEAMKVYVGDIFLLDWIWTPRRWNEHKESLDALFIQKPLAVTFFDSTKPYFPTNRKRYAAMFGCEINSFYDYVVSLSNFIIARYGYAISKVAYCSNRGTFCLLQPAPIERMEEFEISSSKGFVWK